jgi:hypothetical protein
VKGIKKCPIYPCTPSLEAIYKPLDIPVCEIQEKRFLRQENF